MYKKIRNALFSQFGSNKTKLHAISKQKKNFKAIIFIHGLNGDPYKTWKHDKYPSLPELIDQDLEEYDVYSFGYRTSFGFGHKHFSRIANLLYSEIVTRLNHNEDIYIVTHSMGGLIAQQVLIEQIERCNLEFPQRFKGIVYLAVPFQGSNIALLGISRQSNSLKIFDENLNRLRDKWVLNYYQNNVEKGRPNYKIIERIIYGMRDWMVASGSAKPSYVTDFHEVDEDHRSISKIDKDNTVYRLIKDFLQSPCVVQNNTKNKPLVICVHGWMKERYDEVADLELDWTDHFEINSTPRTLPESDVWVNKIESDLKWAIKQWGEKKYSYNGRVRIYSKLCLTGALLIGTRFAETTGTIIEIKHGEDDMWSTKKVNTDIAVNTKLKPGNSTESNAAVVIISVSDDNQNEVETYIRDVQLIYREIVNILPSQGAGRQSIQTNDQAVLYAMGVKDIMSELKSRSIIEIHLFINSPLIVAVFVGHFLTARCIIQTYEFTGVGYIPSCRL